MTNEMVRRSMARKGGIAAWAAMASIALAAVPLAAQTATTTMLEPIAQTQGGHTVTTYSATVQANDGTPASGVVQLEENGKALASSVVDSDGRAVIHADGLGGDHALRAVYAGDGSHAASYSASIAVHADATVTPSFALSINPSTITVAAPGDSGTLAATITPQNGFTGFVSLSCSGVGGTTSTTGGSNLPVGVTCTFTPANLEITSTTAVKAQMVLQTTTGQQLTLNRHIHPDVASERPIVMALALPGAFAMVLIGRKRKSWRPAGWLSLVVLVCTLSMTACNPRYSYLKHKPTFTGTPVGTFPLLVTAQTSNGVTASTQSVSLTLAVQ